MCRKELLYSIIIELGEVAEILIFTIFFPFCVR